MRNSPASGRTSTSRSPASRSGSSELSRRGTFPLAIPAWKIAPALAYGNTVVFKPADLVPGSAHALAEIIVRAGVPKGVFNLVVGRGSVVGQAILDHKKVDAVTFTGSVATGRQRRGRLRRARCAGSSSKWAAKILSSCLPTPT